MKSFLVLSLLWILALGAAAQNPAVPPPAPVALPAISEKLAKFTAVFEKHDAYTAVEIKALKADLDAYANKKIYLEGPFANFRDELPAHLDHAGFTAAKYYLFFLARLQVPILWKRDNDSKLLFTELPRGATLRIYGELKKLRQPTKKGRGPGYYFAPAGVKVLKMPAEPGAGRAEPPPPVAVGADGQAPE